jgi:hypothetical protein
MLSGNTTYGYWQVNTVVRRGTASAAATGVGLVGLGTEGERRNESCA